MFGHCTFFVFCLLVVAGHTPGDTASVEARDPAVAESVEAGVIEGRVTYDHDPNRPWRYARYYVNSKSGELAEAVVAIQARRLREIKATVPVTVEIDQKNFQFQPETVSIRRGDSVKFTNSDGATHNVKSASDLARFNLTTPAGGEQTVRFERAGGSGRPVEIGCAYHSNMRAWVFVFNHPFHAVTPADGRFRFEDVPPGRYELEMVHPAGGLRWHEKFEVRAGATLNVDIRVSPDYKR